MTAATAAAMARVEGPFAVLGAKLHGEEDGDEALHGVEEEGEHAERGAAGADHVGGADVAAAGFANVFLADEADEEVAKGDGAEQVRRRQGNDPESHNRSLVSVAAGVCGRFRARQSGR